jgi:hypothetical protein
MSKENCYLFAKLESLGEDTYRLRVHRKDLQGNPREKIIEIVNDKQLFKTLLKLLESFSMEKDYLIEKIEQGLK